MYLACMLASEHHMNLQLVDRRLSSLTYTVMHI